MKNTIIFITFIFFVLEFYAFQAIRMLTEKSSIRIGYGIVTLLIYAMIFYSISADPKPRQSVINLSIALFVSTVLTKLFIIIFLFIDDVFRFFQYVFQLSSDARAQYPSRKKFLSMLGVGLFSIAALAVLDGVAFGRFRHKVRRVRLKIKGLPSAFRGYKVIQLSDLHSGSFPDAEKLRFTIDMINAEKPDLVLFTGDAVNNYAEEFIPFIPLFRDIRAKDGKYSVLGNHDYGLYGEFSSEEERQKNIPKLVQYFEKAGFKMLRNTHISIEKNQEKIEVLGVENWGEAPFPQIGDLDKALLGTNSNTVKILMSHDPTHFDHIVKHHPTPIALTLSGHTHGMQFGLDLKNIRWSPVQYRYPKWADLYESNHKFLYVNRGFGVIGFPGRVGINPEITLFTLENGD